MFLTTLAVLRRAGGKFCRIFSRLGFVRCFPPSETGTGGARGSGRDSEMPCDPFVRMGCHSNALTLRWTDCPQEFLLFFVLSFSSGQKIFVYDFLLLLFNVCLPTKTEGQTHGSSDWASVSIAWFLVLRNTGRLAGARRNGRVFAVSE